MVAESHRPVVLFETGLAPRYYLPKLDVRLEWKFLIDIQVNYGSADIRGERHEFPAAASLASSRNRPRSLSNGIDHFNACTKKRCSNRSDQDMLFEHWLILHVC